MEQLSACSAESRARATTVRSQAQLYEATMRASFLELTLCISRTIFRHEYVIELVQRWKTEQRSYQNARHVKIMSVVRRGLEDGSCRWARQCVHCWMEGTRHNRTICTALIQTLGGAWRHRVLSTHRVDLNHKIAVQAVGGMHTVLTRWAIETKLNSAREWSARCQLQGALLTTLHVG